MPDRWSASNGEGVWYGRSRRTAVINAHRGERPLSLQSSGSIRPATVLFRMLGNVGSNIQQSAPHPRTRRFEKSPAISFYKPR